MTTPTTAGVADLDPFERFNRMNGMGRVQNPYPVFVELRNESPIQKADLRKMFGLEVPEPPPGSPPVYSASSYEAVLQVLRDGETFSSKMYAGVMGVVMGHSILEMDEPEHHRYRALLQQAFTKKSLELWEQSLVGAVIDELTDVFVGEGRAELVRQLTFPFPVNVIAGLLGLPRDDIPQFHRWTVELISVGIDFEGAIRASNALKEYLAGFLAERRVNPGDDMISVLAQAEMDGQRLDDEDIYAFLRLLLPAGAETTYRSSSNLLYGLLTHPDQLRAVVDDRSLIPQAIEEGLRWEPPLLTIMRSATKDTEVCGVPIEEGAVIIVNMGSANHDDSRWDNAEDLDIFRKATQHIAFAFGPHMCLGQHLARMETRVLLNKIFDRLPNLRTDPDVPEGPITGMTFRSPTALPVLFG
jgi:cytochrome P450